MRSQKIRTWPLLASLLILGLMAGCVYLAVVQGMRSVRSGSGAPAGGLRAWHDAAGDLWVETPLYVWNITGGESVSLHLAEGQEHWYPEDHRPGERILDTLFLSNDVTGTLRSRIVFSLPDRAIIYIERDVPGGAEGLELAFRAGDGVVRVTHAWVGEQMPAEVSAAAAELGNLEGQFVREMVAGLSAEDRVHLAANYSFFVRFDPALGSLTLLPPRDDARRIGAASPGCSSEGIPSEEAPVDRWQRDAGGLLFQDACQFSGFFLPGQILGSEYLHFFSEDRQLMLQPADPERGPLRLAAPDLDAAYIERTPHYSYRAAQNEPLPGDPVTFVAHVRNPGTRSTGPFDYVWRVDGARVLSATHPGLPASSGITLSLPWVWEDGAHRIGIDLDPENALVEVSEDNNRLEDRTDALAVGFWVEQSVYDYFDAHQVERELGSVSWEDWAQRQLAVMNQLLATAVHPLTPDGVLDRVRLDRVTVVPDGALPPCATNMPAPTDETVDLQWGFPAELVGVDVGHTCGALDYYFDYPLAQDVDYALPHELSHARYLVDLNGVDLRAGRAVLASRIGRSDTVVPVDRDVALDDAFPLPAYLAVDGELLICQEKTGSAFLRCERGAEGTTPRAHAAGNMVYAAVVRIQDGRGNLVLGSPALPVLGGILYRNRYVEDLMSGGIAFGSHSAYAWNRIAGERPCCGNANPPANIGDYLNDIPAENVIEIRDDEGDVVPGARVDVFRARPFPVWYGKMYRGRPDGTYQTGLYGRAYLGPNPFTGGGRITHQYGHSDALILLRITAGDVVAYRFLDVTRANEAYWQGQRAVAVYTVLLPRTR